MNRMIKLFAVSIASLVLATSLSAQTPPYVRTIIVGGAGAPVVNGANFFNAVIGIAAPGPANRWLVKLEPGTYDIGVLTLVLRDYVDIEGSGRGVTVISSIQAAGATITDYATGTIYAGSGSSVFAPAGVHAELRELTVENHCPNGGGIGILSNSAEVRLSRLHVKVETPVAAAGIALGGDSRLVEVSVEASCTWASGFSTGISIQDSSPHLEDVTIATTGAATGGHRGLRAENSNTVIDRLRVKAPANLSSTPYAEGVSLSSTTGATYTPKIFNSYIEAGASGSGSHAFGMVVAGGNTLQPEIRDTVTKASTAAYAAGVLVLSGADFRVHGSTLQGSTHPYRNLAGTIRIGVSQLLGTSAFDPGVVCASSYDGAYNPLNGPC